jgi:transcriptional regulator with XRE-family HTH domain
MMIGDRLREIREQRNFSQGDVEKRTGLLRCYISRVENGHTVPSVETIEKLARAFELPMYHLLYEGEKPPQPPVFVRGATEAVEWGSKGKDARFLYKLQRLLGRMNERNRRLLFVFAQHVARRRSKR